ncbi:MAG: caspase family protein [Gaiellaceae bacterium]
MAAAHGDGTIRWHRMSDGAELLAFMPFPDRSNWVAWTPEGFYAATDGARNVLRWHVNRGWDKPASSVSVDAVKTNYERPTALPFVLQELETARALGLADIVEAKAVAETILDSPVPPGPQLHLLAIGISAYNTTHAQRLHLDYADRDAEEFADKIASTQEGFYTVNKLVLSNEDAGKKAIMRALGTEQRGMEKGGGNDLAIVYFSGHGAIVDGELYLLPYDVDPRDPDALKATALSIDDLRRELVKLAGHGRVLVLLDACHSGATTIDGARSMDSTLLRTTLAAANITVLTSSSSTELSREDKTWGHGAFTKVLLEALNDPVADINHNHLINAYGLANYVATHVLALTGGAQNPGAEVRFSSTLFASGK